MTQRHAQTEMAHLAVRGKPQSLEEQCAIALGRERVARLNPSEQLLAAMLRARGLSIIPQQAIGPYNCDIGASPVAVEIWGGHWHWSPEHMARTPKRMRYLMDGGWHIWVIQVTRQYPLTPEHADEVVAFVQETRRDPAMVRQYRMVRRAGEVFTTGSAKDHEITIIPPFAQRRNPTTGRYERITRDASDV